MWIHFVVRGRPQMTIPRMRIARSNPQPRNTHTQYVDCVWNVMAHAQKPNFIFRRNGRVHLNRRGASVQSTAGSRGVRISGSRTPCYEVVWSVLATHSIRQFPLHFPSRASPCAITFQLESNTYCFSTASMVARTRLHVTLYVRYLSCFYFISSTRWSCMTFALSTIKFHTAIMNWNELLYSL